MANPSRRVRRSSHCFRTTSCRKNKRRPPQIVGCSSSLLEEGDVLTVEDAERLLQRLDLLLAARNAVLVRHTGIHARRLELVVVRQYRVELLLRALEVSLLRRQGALLVRLLRRLVLHVLRVRSAVHRRLAAELVERALRLSLRGLGVRLETREVRGDHLQHAQHTAALRLHARVGLVEDLRLLLVRLDERRGLAGLLVELLQDRHRLGHGGLRLLRVLDRLRVLRLLRLADLRRLRNRLVDRRDLGRQVRDLLRELRNGGRELVDLRVQGLDRRGLLLARLLVRAQLRVAPALVLGLLVRLLHEPDDQVLDHLLHLGERVLRDTDRQRRQHAAVDRGALLAKELGDAGLRRVARRRGDLEERHLVLDEAREVLVRGTRDRTRGQDLDRLVNRRELVRAELLALLEVGRLLRALSHEVIQVHLVRVAGRRRVSEVALVLRRLLELRRLLLGLRLAVLRRSLDLRREVLDQHLVRVASVRLLLLEVRALVLELVVELLEHVNDALRLELVSVRLRGRDGHRVLAELVTLRKERADHLLRVLRDELQRVHLHELRLRAVIRLLLQHSDRTLKRIHGLRVVLVGRHVVRVLHLANLSRRLLVALPDGDVLVQAGDLLRERRGIRLRLLDSSRQLLHLGVRLLDRTLLLHRRVIAELLVRGELHLLLVLLLLALLGHALQEPNDLLDRSYLHGGNQCEEE